MRLKGGSLHPVRDNVVRLLLHRQHIVLKRQHHRPHDAVRVGSNFLPCAPEHRHLALHIAVVYGKVRLLFKAVLCSVVEPYGALIVYDRRIKAHIPHHGASVLVADMPQIGKRAGGIFGNRHADRLRIAAVSVFSGHAVVEVEFSIIAPHHIRRIHVFPAGVRGIPGCPVGNPLAPPVRQIRDRGGIHHIIQHAEGMTSLRIVGSV